MYPKASSERLDRESFRFDLVIGRMLPSADLATVTVLDLSGAGLCLLRAEVMQRMVALTQLSLANNSLDDEALTNGGLEHLSRLRALDLSGNPVRCCYSRSRVWRPRVPCFFASIAQL